MIAFATSAGLILYLDQILLITPDSIIFFMLKVLMEDIIRFIFKQTY